jgi:hypothetical protein
MIGNGVRAEQLGVWFIALQRNFYIDRYRSNACTLKKIDQYNFIGIDCAVLNTSNTSPTL